MSLKEFQLFFYESISDLYPKSEIDTFFSIILKEQLDLQRIDTVLTPNLLLDSKDLSTLKKITHRLQKEEPIQYILGKTEFFGLPFLVDKNTLIPRPETEELVSWIIKAVKEISNSKATQLQNKKDLDNDIKILDIGTGSGCIAVSLKKELPKTTVFAVDVSKNSLAIAQQNATLNKVDINFIALDILKTEELWEQFDIIVSNPPYVRELEKREIKNNVLQNEPHLALFVPNDNPLIFYKKIGELAKKHLNNKGQLFFEINQYLGNETTKILSKLGFSSIKLKKDIFNNDRMIKATF